MNVDMGKVLMVDKKVKELTELMKKASSIDERIEIQFKISDFIYKNLNQEEALKLHFLWRNEKQK